MTSAIGVVLFLSTFVFIFTCVDGRAVMLPLSGEETAEENAEVKFLRSDVNDDDKLTFDEFLHMELPYERIKKDEFDLFDTNGDGILTVEEYESRLVEKKEKSMDRRAQYFGNIYMDFDENFDMKLNKKEVENVLRERFMLKPRTNFAKTFNRFDINGDGGLDIEEYMKFDEEMPFEELQPIDEVPVVSKAQQKKEKLPLQKNMPFQSF